MTSKSLSARFLAGCPSRQEEGNIARFSVGCEAREEDDDEEGGEEEEEEEEEGEEEEEEEGEEDIDFL